MPGFGEFGIGSQNIMLGMRRQMAQFALRFTRGPIEPIITAWPTATGITYGQPLSDSARTGGSAVTPVGASVSGSFVWADGTTMFNAGTHSASIFFVPDDTDAYETVLGSIDVVVAVRPITVSADGKTKEYGQSDPALTYSITSGSLVGSDSFTGSITRAAGSGVGTYAITQGTLALSANYDMTFNGGSFVIGKATPQIYNHSASGILSGNSYTTSTISGSARNPHNLAAVAGNFSWVAGQTPSVPYAVHSPASYTIQFTPTDTTNYNSATATVLMAITGQWVQASLNTGTNTNYSWTVPAHTTSVRALVVGGGAASGQLTNIGTHFWTGGGGGGGGRYRWFTNLPVSAGSSVHYRIGRGGTTGDGTYSEVINSSYRAGGGGRGGSSASTPQAGSNAPSGGGGGGGGGRWTSIAASGGSGSSGGNGGSGGGGGGGASGNGSNGANADNRPANGGNGVNFNQHGVVLTCGRGGQGYTGQSDYNYTVSGGSAANPGHGGNARVSSGSSVRGPGANGTVRIFYFR